MKKMIATLVCTGVVLSLIACVGNAAPVAVPDKDKKPAQEKFIIPKDVKAVMEAGLATRQPMKTDIPFTVSQAITMPGPQQITYVYLLLNAKNADMGYAAPAAPAIVDPTGAVAPVKLQTKMHTFVQFYRLESGVPPALAKEIYIPASFESESTGYNPEASDWYSFGYPLMPGNYLASIALSSEDLKKGGVQYYEFAVADPASFTEKLETSTILCMKDFQQVETPETKAEMHRGQLAWSIARITPNLTKTIKVGDSLDLFFYIYGAKPNAEGKFDLQIEFEVRQGDKPQIRFAPGEFQSPLISLPLPMQQTLEIRTGDKVETKQQNLPAGSYVMLLKITDKISGLKGEKQIEFVVE
jgi:predicted small lipoprotein YifL